MSLVVVYIFMSMCIIADIYFSSVKLAMNLYWPSTYAQNYQICCCVNVCNERTGEFSL